MFINDRSLSMMSSSGQSSPAVRRLLYVEIPPSPLHLSSKQARTPLPHRPIPSELKENTRPSHVQMENFDGATLKRKLEAAVTTEPPAMPIPKKQKLTDATSGQVGVDYCYCHQCGKKREISSGFDTLVLVTYDINRHQVPYSAPSRKPVGKRITIVARTGSVSHVCQIAMVRI